MDPITQFIFAAAAGAGRGELEVNFLVIGGGGGGGNTGPQSGGGAGGYITSWNPNNLSTVYSGAQAQTLNPVTLLLGYAYNITVGAGGNYGTGKGGNSQFSGYNSINAAFSHSAVGGGLGGSLVTAPVAQEQNGGSGGASALYGNLAQPIGYGTAYQGTNGYGLAAMGQETNSYLCFLYGASSYWCQLSYSLGGGGGGSSTPGYWQDGGLGTYSDITGTNTAYAAGGHGEGTYSYSAANHPGGYQTPNSGGGGRGGTSSGAAGVVILRFPSSFSYTCNSLNPTASTVGTDTVLTFTNGAGTITFS